MATKDRSAEILSPVSDGYLTGQLLVATPQIQSSCFHRSVIYLATHTEEGAMGFIINQPLERFTINKVLGHFGMEAVASDGAEAPVYFGGPVDTSRGYVLHSTEYHGIGTAQMSHQLALTSNLDVLKDIAFGRGPAQKLLVLGYAGWGAGQLEAELEANNWITVPATPELLFGQQNIDKWMLSNRSLGIDPYRISDIAGHA